MRVGLFVPCFIDAFYPRVAIATLELLERFGIAVDYPLDQTCCGQPMANNGCQTDAVATEALFARNFTGYDYVVAPSASCTHHIRRHFDAIPQTDEVIRLRATTYELVEFLHDIVKPSGFPWAEFPHTVVLHNSCSALRALGQASVSEIAGEPFSKPLALLCQVKGLKTVQPARPDECCGFGGTFAVFEEPVSARMGQDKVRDFAETGAAYVVSADYSCLMHQQGCAERLGLGLEFIHVAEILNGARA
jgi:L-lactate dehydrogenase complex protein LldE